MSRHVARLLSLALVAVSLFVVWPNRTEIWSVVIVDGVALLLIWFPSEIDDYTFGNTGYRVQINKHTPPFLIAGFGWILLALFTVILLRHAAKTRGF